MVRRTRRLQDITPRTGAGINQRRVPQFLPNREINFAPFALGVRRERSAHVGPFIPLQAKPVKIFDDGIAKLCPTPIIIQIFDPENELSIALAGPFLGAPERHRVADVNVTRRRWGNAATVGNFRFQIGDFRLA
jgi:hypothetical protein